MAKPFESLSASVNPLSPSVVENLINTEVLLPTPFRNLAFVHFPQQVVVSKYPNPPEPTACTTLSGILSLSNLASLSMRLMSDKTIGPLGPAVKEFWLSSTG